MVFLLKQMATQPGGRSNASNGGLRKGWRQGSVRKTMGHGGTMVSAGKQAWLSLRLGTSAESGLEV